MKKNTKLPWPRAPRLARYQEKRVPGIGQFSSLGYSFLATVKKNFYCILENIFSLPFLPSGGGEG
jgi:hypothetical protein